MTFFCVTLYFGDHCPLLTRMVVVGIISRYLALSAAFTMKTH